jgi:phospholipase C
MGDYDGNTVTAIWNHAQHFATSDNFFASTFGRPTVTPASISGKVVEGSITANVNPTLDDCSTGRVVTMGGRNTRDLLNAKAVRWGWFYGDWMATSSGNAECGAIYNARYAPFQYYASTANPHHRPPTSLAMIGHTDQANHQYSIADLWNAADQGNLPAVTFMKASVTQTGHASDSSPLAEQQFLVATINRLERLPQWPEMAILHNL